MLFLISPSTLKPVSIGIELVSMVTPLIAKLSAGGGEMIALRLPCKEASFPAEMLSKVFEDTHLFYNVEESPAEFYQPGVCLFGNWMTLK